MNTGSYTIKNKRLARVLRAVSAPLFRLLSRSFGIGFISEMVCAESVPRRDSRILRKTDHQDANEPPKVQVVGAAESGPPRAAH